MLLLVGGLLGGCWLGQAGMELPHQLPGESYPGDRGELTGVLDVADNGCRHIVLDAGTYFVIWPSGSDAADLGELPAGVRLPGGDVIADGDTLVGTGALTPTAPLTADRNGWWAHVIGYCAPDASEVFVFDSARGGE